MLRRNVDDPGVLAPLIVWIAPQLIALLLAAAHVRLWATAPVATETLALNELVIAQFLIASLLVPFVCRTWHSTCAIALASLPMICLAGALAKSEVRTELFVACDLLLWLFTLRCSQHILISPAAQLVGVALSSTLITVVPMLVYFASEPRGDWIDASRFSPLLATMHPPGNSAWLGLQVNFTYFAVSAFLVAIGLVIRKSIKRQVIHRNHPQ